jgi:hypothetical protein
MSDIGEGALVLPVEPAFYWVSTNNGDDNQLFSDILARNENDFSRSLEEVLAVAPYGAQEMQSRMMGTFVQEDPGLGGVSGAVNSMLETGIRDSSL